MINGQRFGSDKGPLTLLGGARALVSVPRKLASEVSNESEGWFRFSLSTAERSVVWAEQRVGALARRVRLWPGSKCPRERIQLLLRKEAKRAPIAAAAPADLDLFTEQMAILIDLVLSGAIGIHEVAFEAFEANAPAAEEPQSGEANAPAAEEPRSGALGQSAHQVHEGPKEAQ
jgi:hypothetical protein